MILILKSCARMQLIHFLSQWRALLYFFIFILSHFAPALAENGNVKESNMATGRSMLATWQKEAVKPRYGPCWAAALKALDEGCRHLTEDVQHRLTLRFTNCFLEKTGRRKHDCELSRPIEQCVGHMSSESYGVYAEFFAHTQSVCFYLEAESWQEQSESIMLRLANHSAVVSEQMENASFLQIELLRRQNDSISHQETILETGKKLKQTIEESKIDVHLMMSDFKATTAEQRALIFDVFDRVRSLQNIVLDEFTGIYSIVCYVCSTVLVYIVTSAPRTAGARVWLFLAIICCALTESAITFWMCDKQIMGRSGTSTSDEERAVVLAMVRWCRRFYIMVALLVYFWIAYHYQDYNIINNQLLLDIKRQMLQQHSELKNWIPTGDLTSRLSLHSYVNPMNIVPHGGVQKSLEFIKAASHSRFTPASDDSSSSSDDYNEDNDTTFHGSFYRRSSSESEMSDYSRLSRGTTPSLLDELEDLRKATPLKELSLANLKMPVQNLIGLWNKRSDDGNSSIGSSEHNLTASVTTTHSYNLRLRTRNMPSPTQNPILQHESPRSFAHQVKVKSRLSIPSSDRVGSQQQHHQASSPFL